MLQSLPWLVAFVGPSILCTALQLSAQRNVNRLEALRGLAQRARGSSLEPRVLLDTLPSITAPLQAITSSEFEVILGRKLDRSALSQALGGQEQKGLGFTALGLKDVLDENHANVPALLQRFRRVVALRQNRVLMPARAAQLYANLINACISADEDDLAVQVLDYVGLTPTQYLEVQAGNKGVVDLNGLGFQVGRVMLDLDLERWEWESVGSKRGEAEPLGARERGEAIAEWSWRQVFPAGGRAEVEYRAADMTLAAVRLALRQAVREGLHAVEIRRQVIDAHERYLHTAKRGVTLPDGSLELVADLEAGELGTELEISVVEGQLVEPPLIEHNIRTAAA